MNKLEVTVILQNEATNETLIITLPNSDFDTQYKALTHNGSYTATVKSISANFDFSGRNVNVKSLNNLLESINKLNAAHKAKFMDLYSIEEKSHLGLLIAYTDEKHYEIIDRETSGCNDYNELKRRAGALYMLGICPDIMITLDGNGCLSNEDREAFFREGIRSGGIHLIGDKFYIKDKYLLEAATDKDIDYYEAEERIYESQNHK